MSIQNQTNVKLFRPFGPTIMEMDMPEEVVNNVNNYVENWGKLDLLLTSNLLSEIYIPYFGEIILGENWEEG